MSTHPRPVLLAAMVLALVVGLSSVPAMAKPPKGNQTPPPRGAEATSSMNRDFATEVLGDPWDFSNPEDAPLAHGPPVSMYVTDAGFVDGTYQWTSDGGFLDLHPMTVPGALPDSRDARWNPVDADRYTHVSLRLYASRDQILRTSWFTCTHDYPGCDRWHSIWVQEGWHTYTLPMRQLSDDWRGDLQGIRLGSGPGTTTFRLDWLRIHAADASPTPPAGAPQPRILSPNAAGDEDAATVLRGDPWDFSNAADVVATGNVANGRIEGGQLHGTNGPPVVNDPWVQLAHGPGIDPDRHHLLTVTTTYDGGFSLDDRAGGGMHGRWLFRRADSGLRWMDSREFVTYPSRPTVTYDLKDGRFGSAVEPASLPWTGSTITGVRWDPNEDRGPRSWRVDEIRLAAPHEASGLFDVVWTDPAHVDGTRVDIGVSRTRGDVEGAAVATDVVQRPGENRVRLDVADLAPGSWWVWVRATAPHGVTSATTAQGELVATGRVAGPDRVATSLSLSQVGWPDGADAVVVASARGFADALAGVQLADAVDGPLVLTEPGHLDPALARELARLDPAEVFVLGGAQAISAGVGEAIAAAAGEAAALRVAGADRYATATAIADLAESRWREDGLQVADQVVLASGTTFPDALAAGPFVAATRTPLLLTARDELPAATRAALRSRPTADVVVVGGPVAVGEAVADATGRAVRRIAGADRYATAHELADAAVAAGASPARTLVASGERFPDALGAGALAARTGDTLVLTAHGQVPAATRAWLGQPAVTRAMVIGGRVAVAADVVADLHALARG